VPPLYHVPTDAFRLNGKTSKSAGGETSGFNNTSDMSSAMACADSLLAGSGAVALASGVV